MKPTYVQDDVIYDIQREIETWIENPGHSSRFGALYVFVGKALSVELDPAREKKLLNALKSLQEQLRASAYEGLSEIVAQVKSWKQDTSSPLNSNIPKSAADPLKEIQAIIESINNQKS